MTRDEAIKKFKDAADGSFSSEAWIDRFTALGILKLDEPKSAREKFISAMRSHGYHQDSIGLEEALASIEKANLKLVEK